MVKLTKDQVVFELKSRFHANYASKILRLRGEEVWYLDKEVLHNPQAKLYPYLVYDVVFNRWLTSDSTFDLGVLPISKLNEILDNSGVQPEIPDEVWLEIDNEISEHEDNRVRCLKRKHYD